MVGDGTDTNKNNNEILELGILNELIGYQLRRAQLKLFHSFSNTLGEDNITPGQLALLIKIKNNAGISQTALAKANGIERSTLGEIIDRFEKRELVERRKHPSDRRVYALHLTEQGEIFLGDLMPAVLQHEADITRGWSTEERSTLLQLLVKLAG